MRVRFHTTIEEELLTAIKIIAVKNGKKTNDILEDIIKLYLKENINEYNKEQ